jgi:hypothetical protein
MLPDPAFAAGAATPYGHDQAAEEAPDVAGTGGPVLGRFGLRSPTMVGEAGCPDGGEYRLLPEPRASLRFGLRVGLAAVDGARLWGFAQVL